MQMQHELFETLRSAEFNFLQDPLPFGYGLTIRCSPIQAGDNRKGRNNYMAFALLKQPVLDYLFFKN